MMVCTYVRVQLSTPAPPHAQHIYLPQDRSSLLPEDHPAKRRRGPVVSGVVPAKVGRARDWDEAQAPAPQVLLARLFIHSTLYIHIVFHATVKVAN